MLRVGSRFAKLPFAIFAVTMIALAVIGGIRTFSPVPWADMWDGGLAFVMRAARGDEGIWWAQHNEHRIVLARLLFWLDYRFFSGMTYFLITANYVFVLISAALFWQILRDLSESTIRDTGQVVVGCLVTAWLFQWMQAQNLNWSFQSQFFLAQLLPLAALYMLSRAVTETGRSWHFFLAAGLGTASIGAMANGVMVLPLMTLFAAIAGMGRLRVTVLAALSVLSLYLYFHHYVPPGGHGSLSHALHNDPLGLLQYVLLYLGSPFYYLLREGQGARSVAMFAGVVLIASSIILAIQVLRVPRKAPLKMALLVYVLYIGGTALGTAGGRLILGVDQSLSGRYTTPALMAWASLLMLNLDRVLYFLRSRGAWSVAPLAIFMIVQQAHAVWTTGDPGFERNISALAISIGAKDDAAIRPVFPAPEVARRIGEDAVAGNVSLFGTAPYRDMRERLGTEVTIAGASRCPGGLDDVQAIPGEAAFVKVRGWIFDKTAGTSSPLVNILDRHHRTIGFAMLGEPRPDVAGVVGKGAFRSGFVGYMRANALGTVVMASSESPSCFISANVPRPPITALEMEGVSASDTARSRQTQTGTNRPAPINTQ